MLNSVLGCNVAIDTQVSSEENLDLIISDNLLLHRIYNVPKDCDIESLFTYRMVGKYLFDVDFRSKRLSLACTNAGEEFALLVPNDLLRFSLGLEKSGWHFSVNSKIKFTYPTSLYTF